MSKQTSLQFFLMGLIDLEIGKGISTDKEIQLHNLYAQAKAMEREQIIEAHMHMRCIKTDDPYECSNNAVYQSRQYYNDTYKGGEQ
jgi:hypothetical protein